MPITFIGYEQDKHCMKKMCRAGKGMEVHSYLLPPCISEPTFIVIYSQMFPDLLQNYLTLNE